MNYEIQNIRNFSIIAPTTPSTATGKPTVFLTGTVHLSHFDYKTLKILQSHNMTFHPVLPPRENTQFSRPLSVNVSNYKNKPHWFYFI